jgi:hypothetical protein
MAMDDATARVVYGCAFSATQGESERELHNGKMRSRRKLTDARTTLQAYHGQKGAIVSVRSLSTADS